MKTRIALIALTLIPWSPTFAQDLESADTPAGSEDSVPASERIRTDEELDTLFAPIALYPDVLVALVLPASTEPADVVIAARYLASDGDVTRIDDQPWAESVRGLAHYPKIISWMDQNLAWTKEAGEAFLTQPDDVLKSVQRLRARARATGVLADTPQQHIILVGEEIHIVPVAPEVIYVPRYEPRVVFFDEPFYTTTPSWYVSFGTCYAGGWWLSNRIDWHTRCVYVIDRHAREANWAACHEWNRPRTILHGGRPAITQNPPPPSRPWVPTTYRRSHYPHFADNFPSTPQGTDSTHPSNTRGGSTHTGGTNPDRYRGGSRATYSQVADDSGTADSPVSGNRSYYAGRGDRTTQPTRVNGSTTTTERPTTHRPPAPSTPAPAVSVTPGVPSTHLTPGRPASVPHGPAPANPGTYTPPSAAPTFNSTPHTTYVQRGRDTTPTTPAPGASTGMVTTRPTVPAVRPYTPPPAPPPPSTPTVGTTTTNNTNSTPGTNSNPGSTKSSQNSHRGRDNH